MLEAKLIDATTEGTKIEVFIPHGKTMLESEEIIQASVNEVGKLATIETLRRYDTDGSTIQVGPKTFYYKDDVEKTYETPFGAVSLFRNVYQGVRGGKTYCPLDQSARIVVSSTPRFAKIVSYKYSDMGSKAVIRDLQISNGRHVSRSYVQNVSEAVGAIAMLKEEKWTYVVPKLEGKVSSVTVGLDGTCMYLKDEGYRVAMVGSIAMYHRSGQRMHTVYVAANPEYGKDTFMKRLENEVLQAKQYYPNATYIGLADGAKENWPFLEEHTDVQTIDFYHVSEYLGDVAEVVLKNSDERETWLEQVCHRLKHKRGAANRIYRELLQFQKCRMKKADKKVVDGAVTYFKNNKHRMKYDQNTQKNFPIGSGVTEAACKVIIKQRLCRSGMKWKDRGSAIVLSLRTIAQTEGRWNQFWQKIDQFGLPKAA